ncbi:MAG: hypothetical protein IPQ07_05955 [Myxococcales bacterium]|nr:hypothetical protein [Myxococcales bacterium]
MTRARRATVGRWLAAGLAIAFGVATVAEGGRVVFGGHHDGPVVTFVVVFNFLAGFVYVAVGAAILGRRRWAPAAAWAVTAATALVFGAFAVHAGSGGAFAPRTFAAMSLRMVFWLVLAVVLSRQLTRRAVSR